MLCECCREHEVWDEAASRGYPWCEECCTVTECCGKPLSDNGCTGQTSEHLIWDKELCDECQAEQAWEAWREETTERAREICERNGWAFGDSSGGFNTRSVYYTIERDGYADVKLRISDHGTCYCTEDYSLAYRPSGDDGTLAGFERFLLSREPY